MVHNRVALPHVSWGNRSIITLFPCLSKENDKVLSQTLQLLAHRTTNFILWWIWTIWFMWIWHLFKRKGYPQNGTEQSSSMIELEIFKIYVGKISLNQSKIFFLKFCWHYPSIKGKKIVKWLKLEFFVKSKKLQFRKNFCTFIILIPNILDKNLRSLSTWSSTIFHKTS